MTLQIMELKDTAKRFMATQVPVWGDDVSGWEDRDDTIAVPDLTVAPDLGASFMSTKATQGAGDYGGIDKDVKGD